MGLWVVVGGQFGSEGKGKISAHITLQEDIDICIRCGGPNSGHSFVDDSGNIVVLRQLPTGYIRPGTRLLIPAGALVDLVVLKNELDILGLDSSRVGVDRNAMIVESLDKETERRLELRERLSSTLCGVGSAVARRALRGADVRLARHAAESNSWLQPLITNVAEEANAALDSQKSVLVEGTQGFGLSLYHSDEYPKATSRDTSAAGFLGEVGLSPRLVTEIVVVFRTFPIRVAGEQAGHLKEEINWGTLQQESGYPYPVEEYTSVTRKLRRIGRFDWDLAVKAVTTNRPTRIAINGLDYLSYRNRGIGRWDQLSTRAKDFVEQLEMKLRVAVGYCGIGPALHEVLVRSPEDHTMVSIPAHEASESAYYRP